MSDRVRPFHFEMMRGTAPSQTESDRVRPFHMPFATTPCEINLISSWKVEVSFMKNKITQKSLEQSKLNLDIATGAREY